MTRSVEVITREEKIDLRVLVDYIKLDLFPKAKFVLGKNEWDVGGRIYNDYIKCCHGRSGLQTMNDVVRESYMEKIWMKALTKNIQKKALVQKRSAIYTVMQNRFAGTLKNRGKCLNTGDCISSIAILGCKQIYVLFVLRIHAYCHQYRA
jgi:hypothetical protein